MNKTKEEILEAMDAWADQCVEKYKEKLKAKFKEWFEDEEEITIATIFKIIG